MGETIKPNNFTVLEKSFKRSKSIYRIKIQSTFKKTYDTDYTQNVTRTVFLNLNINRRQPFDRKSAWG